MAAKTTKNEAVTAEEKQVKAKESKGNKVPIMVAMIEGEDEYVNVGVNGHYTQVRRGVQVEVDPSVAEVLKNSNFQMMAALETQKKFENQEFDFE